MTRQLNLFDLLDTPAGPALAGAALEIKTWLDSTTGVSVSFVREVLNIRPYAGPDRRQYGSYRYTADIVVFDGLVETIDINPTMGAGSNRWHPHDHGDFLWDDYATSKHGAWVRLPIGWDGERYWKEPFSTRSNWEPAA